MLTRKFELEATIKYYEDLSLWGNLIKDEKAKLAKAKAELKEYENKNNQA